MGDIEHGRPKVEPVWKVSGRVDRAGTVPASIYQQAMNEKVEAVRENIRLADQLAGAVSRADDLRATVQNILDTGFNYAEEYRWSLQEALDADAKRGQ